MLAETIQLSGPETAALLALFVGFLLAVASVAVISVVAAYRAGKGSQSAMYVTSAFAAFEVVWLVASITEGGPLLPPVGVVAVQAAAYYRGTQKRAPRER